MVAHYTGGVGVAGSNPVSPTSSRSEAILGLVSGLFLCISPSQGMFLTDVACEADFVPASAFMWENLDVYGAKFLGLSTNNEDR